VIPTTSAGGGHVNIATALMFPSLSSSIRRLPSEVDILAAAQADGFLNLNLSLNPQISVPEPGSLLLVAIGLPLLIRRRRWR